MVFKINPTVTHDTLPAGKEPVKPQNADTVAAETSSDKTKADVKPATQEYKQHRTKSKRSRHSPWTRAKLHPELVNFLNDRRYYKDPPFIVYPSSGSSGSLCSSASPSPHPNTNPLMHHSWYYDLYRYKDFYQVSSKPKKSTAAADDLKKDVFSTLLGPMIRYGAVLFHRVSQLIAERLSDSDDGIDSAQVTLITARLCACFLVLLMYPMAGFILFLLLIGCEIIFSQDPSL